ncbi:MAG: TIGR01212 family radical SAM protein [Thermodesulfobacteria bacterium]|nr:TIGR01212 family radical SAM protein [Thermodesulfobacteriota bacterium]
MENGVKFLTLNQFFRKHFGQRVQKIPLDAGLGCPNRRGNSTGCIYCNARGSGTGASMRHIPLSLQLESGILWARRRYKAKRFAAYFQAYSNTYGPLEKLQEIYRQVACHDDVVAVAIGTRPDCIDKDVLDLIARCFQDKMVWMEYGLQSANNETLKGINRGHEVEDFVRAVELTRRYPFFICAHVIFGLPGEGQREMLETVRLLRDLRVDGVKFHELYVIKGTPMAQMFLQGHYAPITQVEYALTVARAIGMLPANTVIQRLTGDPAPGELLAPIWAAYKQETISLIKKFMRDLHL